MARVLTPFLIIFFTILIIARVIGHKNYFKKIHAFLVYGKGSLLKNLPYGTGRLRKRIRYKI